MLPQLAVLENRKVPVARYTLSNLNGARVLNVKITRDARNNYLKDFKIVDILIKNERSGMQRLDVSSVFLCMSFCFYDVSNL